jgi:hypothetical protein
MFNLSPYLYPEPCDPAQVNVEARAGRVVAGGMGGGAVKVLDIAFQGQGFRISSFP